MTVKERRTVNETNMRQQKIHFKTYMLATCLFLSPFLANSCGDGKDEPKDNDIENNGEGNSNVNYDPNSDHALSLALKEKGYGSITDADMEKALIGTWKPICYCAVYWDILDNGKYCDDYDGGYLFKSDGMCYYLDAMGQIEGDAHSWSISGDMLRIYFRGNADDRIYSKLTTKGYLVLTWHGSECWKIYKKY